MRVSERKAQANRTNAMKSIGPKTRKGKARSSQDALKHGLLATAVIIERRESSEERKDSEALLRALQEDLAPEGALEVMLVEKIAVDYWRLRRLLASETGRIRTQLGTLEADERDPWTVADEMDSLRAALEVVAEGLAGETEPEEALSHALDIAGWGGFEGVDVRALVPEKLGEIRQSAENDLTLEGLREVIEERLGNLDKEMITANERFQARLDARRLTMQTPPLDELGLHMRYEAMLERQLQRDLEMLANVQCMRLLGPVGYRPVKALSAERASAASKDGADAES